MQILRRNLLEASRRLSFLLHSPPPAAHAHAHAVATLSAARRDPSAGSLAATPWAATQRRGAKILGSDVKLGNVIQRRGRIYQVIKSHHSHQGRGGATIQVELRDVDTGNKIVERFRTDEALERVFVEDKPFTYLYQEGDNVALMEPNTFEQLEVSKELFGKNAAYLKDEMKVTLQFFDGRALSGSVPPRVTCTVVEAQPNAKGLTATPQYKRVLLDNGLTVLAPPFVEVGENIVVSTVDDSYMTRA
ncbi:elongation factor P-like isoform X1 [Triticum dicoccoides]|uniref:elongation factor P-like isoform X1 n=2 Tax=Triticum dicoccoides TaxID=85692 RepID=UPI001891BA9C|nr:elongation factor P-like isoform X1 [Triticum dicoccoides]